MNNIPQSMNYIQIEKHGDPEVLKLHSMPVPEPGPGEVLIKVAAAGVNRPDMMQRKGLYPPPPGATDVPGLEVSGIPAAFTSEIFSGTGKQIEAAARQYSA